MPYRENQGPSLVKNIDWFLIVNVILINAMGLIVLKGMSSPDQLNVPNLL